MARALVIVDFQNDFTPGGALAVPARRRDRRPASTRSPPPATTTSSSPPATGIPPTTTPSPRRAGRGPCTASPARPAPQLHPALDRTHDRRRSSTRARPSDTDGYSGFEGTDLEAILRERGITQVTVVGLATDYCVKNTALDALRAGFQVTVDTTAVRGVEVEAGDSERALAEVRAAGGVMA